ncbi:FG-GAP repeat domain-containing protein [Oceaniferula spumae]|uniref:FG-GAP repeat domain-containing protein n=1 Tax=Oceaniferula spumae TaxID=2979115 RepID=UPI003F4E697D
MSELFKTYHDFASASLTDIYGDRLEKAFKVTANHLESGVWMNDGKKGEGIKLRWISFPWEAQLSPINDIVSADFNGDGKLELVLAQNHYTNWIETGLWRGNPGCHLEWSESGFKTIQHRKSGIVMPNDTKALLTLDINGDGLQDIIAGQNNDKLLEFRAQK